MLYTSSYSHIAATEAAHKTTPTETLKQRDSVSTEGDWCLFMSRTYTISNKAETSKWRDYLTATLYHEFCLNTQPLAVL